jgi:hypothetical protein
MDSGRCEIGGKPAPTGNLDLRLSFSAGLVMTCSFSSPPIFLLRPELRFVPGQAQEVMPVLALVPVADAQRPPPPHGNCPYSESDDGQRQVQAVIDVPRGELLWRVVPVAVHGTVHRHGRLSILFSTRLLAGTLVRNHAQ